MTTLVSVTSCVAGGFLKQSWKAHEDGDEGGDVENLL